MKFLFVLLLTLIVISPLNAADIDEDGLTDTVEPCNGRFISGLRAGSCDSISLCEFHQTCVQSLGEACACDGSSGGPASGCPTSGTSLCDPATDSTCLIACATTLDFDCDSRTDAQEFADGTDPTDPTSHTGGVTPDDTDNDGVGNSNSLGNCDLDDDNDGKKDSEDSCSAGIINWTSNLSNDTDQDGCQDIGEDACVDPDKDDYGSQPFNKSGCTGTTGPNPATEKFDNCPNDANPDQKDTDGNGIGDACTGTLAPPEPPTIIN